jgi:uncharacterized protein (TIGR02217 family)
MSDYASYNTPKPAFIEHVFPLCCSVGAEGFPHFQTQIVTSGNGNEQRNSQWGPYGRELYNVSVDAFDKDKLRQLLAFWRVIGGKLTGFRFRSPIDNECVNEHIDTFNTRLVGPSNIVPGDNVHQYQLRKKYSIGENDEYVVFRKVIKPVRESITLQVSYNGAPFQVVTTVSGSVVGGGLYNTELYNESPTIVADVEFDWNTGVLTWIGPNPPGNADTLLWTGQFEIPVRFAEDSGLAKYIGFNARSIDLSMIELTEGDSYAS